MNKLENGPEVIFENEDLIAINKPHGLLVHRTAMASDATEFALQIVRKHIGKRVYPVHRLDRKTSGVLLFAKSKEVNSKLQGFFRAQKIDKTYHALVRGYTPLSDKINYALNDGKKTKEAVTAYNCIQQFEINIPSGQFETSRYSLLEIKPETGRYHQIRKHLAHIFHPVIGDRPHGCNKQNKLWKEKFNMTTMLLHASSLTFQDSNSIPITITARQSSEFKRALNILKSNDISNSSLK